MLQMYGSLIKYIRSGSLKDATQINFVDVLNDDLTAYSSAVALLREGYQLPFVAINGVVKFHGGIPYEEVCKEIEKCLQQNK